MRSTKENILILREQGWSQSRLAEELGISQPMVSRWENGEIPNAADVALKLARMAQAIEEAAVNPKNTPNPEISDGVAPTAAAV